MSECTLGFIYLFAEVAEKSILSLPNVTHWSNKRNLFEWNVLSSVFQVFLFEGRSCLNAHTNPASLLPDDTHLLRVKVCRNGGERFTAKRRSI